MWLGVSVVGELLDLGPQDYDGRDRRATGEDGTMLMSLVVLCSRYR